MCWFLKWISLVLGFLYLLSLTNAQDNLSNCGKRKIKTTNLIHNGMDVMLGRWPWHAMIFHRNEKLVEYVCGGTIIDERTILTAAHCVSTEAGVLSTTPVSIYVGRTLLKKIGKYTQKHAVREFILHPGFNKERAIHDIAVVKLNSSIIFNNYVQPVCLWTMDSKQDLIVGRSGTIVGFDYNERDVLSDRLKQVLIGVVDAMSCIGSDRVMFGTHLTSEMFCGTGQLCNFDSGGGVFINNDGKWFVRGLVSYTAMRENSELCDTLEPTAYTDVAKYLEWIKQHTDLRALSHERGALDIDNKEKARQVNTEACGVKYVNNGTRGTLPWLGFVKALKEAESRCTVTLISERNAVGPAHCFENGGVGDIIILGGTSERDKAECVERNGSAIYPHPPQKRRIKSVLCHPKFNKTNLAHNIALIELMSPADTSQPNVKPICVSLTSELRMKSKNNLHVAIPDFEYSYKNIPVRYVEPAECMRQYAQGNIMLKVDNSQLCADIPNNKSRQYCDTLKPGSPLQEWKMINGTKRYFLRGFDMVGLACNIQPPPVYIEAGAYLDWIVRTMKHNPLETRNATVQSLYY